MWDRMVYLENYFFLIFLVRKEIIWNFKFLVNQVFLLLVLFFLSFLFVSLFYVINFFLSVKESTKRKINSFERGFISVGKIQNSFSIHFFIIILMFVIFDLEIVIFLGILISDFFSFISFVFIIFFIIGGFYIEWYYGKLVWVI